MRRIDILISAMLIALVGGAEAFEQPEFDVTILDVKHITTVTQSYCSEPGFKPHIRFPGIERRADGTLRMWWNVGQTRGVYCQGGNAISTDNGQTWSLITSELVLSVRYIKPSGHTSYGFDFSRESAGGFTFFTTPRYRSTNGGHDWYTTESSYISTGSIAYTTMVRNHGDIVEDDGAWLMTGFGKRLGSDKSELVIFASTDLGLNWSRRSSIGYVSDPEIAMGPEGPNEGWIVKLDNGNLLAVYRTGQAFPTCDLYEVHPSMFFSISDDHGSSWSTPKMLGAAANQPNVIKLPDGSVCVTYGRYGGKLMFADPTGTRWSEPFVVYDESSCGSVRMVPTDDGRYVFIYDISSFYNPNTSVVPDCYIYEEGGQEIAHMKAALLEIAPIPPQDSHNWALEYHGDVKPDELDTAWTQNLYGGTWLLAYEGGGWPEDDVPAWTEGGSPKTVTLGSDSGVDFINIDTTVGGSGYYRVSDMVPEIATNELVIEMRARVFDNSTQCGGISFADGTWGGSFRFYVIPGTHNFSIPLAAGGYTYPAIPAPDPADWHTYRVVASGSTWSLYCDGAHIITDDLQAASTNYVTWGDATGPGNDCDIDYDYVRAIGSDIQSYALVAAGRDYLRMDTGPDDADRQLNYTLAADAPGSAWAALDFTEGVVVEFGARVDQNTTEGAATVLAGDGSHSVRVELTDTSVILQGDGDDAGQVVLNGIDPTEWHHYRLAVGADTQAGGSIVAKLYLDEVYTNPALSVTAKGDAAVDAITVGDIVPAANGAFDVDYVRFASALAGQGICGDPQHPYPTGDANKDCIVDLFDFSMIVDNWLTDQRP